MIRWVSHHFLQPVIQILPGVGNDVFLPIMISRLMLSLRKAASAKNGWSLTEMTTIRRVEELRFADHGSSNQTRPWLDGDRSQTGFSAPTRAEDSDQNSGDVVEEIGVACTKGWEGPDIPGGV